MEDISLSCHGLKRLQERYDLDEVEECEYMVDRAWRNGKTSDCFTGQMYKFLHKIEYNDTTGRAVVRVHAKNCYIFTEYGKLITVYKIRNYEKYMNTLKPYEEEYEFEVA